MGKAIKTFGVIIISFSILYFVVTKFIITSMETDVAGKWELVDGDGCFISLSIYDGMKDSRMLSFYEEDESIQTTYTYRAFYTYDKDVLNITEVTNFDDVEPFDIHYERRDDALHTSYEWKNQSYICVYKEAEE